MIIEIDDTRTLGEIAREFSIQYPFLKLEFYDTPHEWQEGSELKHLLPEHLRISGIRNRHNPGSLEIRPGFKTGAVEQEFRKRFGLNVQIFRRHGNRWIQTVGTDEFSLEEQNETGMNASQDSLYGNNWSALRNKAI